jgi:hypothetical protein
MQIVTKYGTMWARNAENIAKIPSSSKGGLGVYILFVALFGLKFWKSSRHK